jgi:hypothetical protein
MLRVLSLLVCELFLIFMNMKNRDRFIKTGYSDSKH